MARFAVMLLTLALAAPPAAAAGRFTLGLEGINLEPVDPRTEARLARWNSPMGRLAAHMQREQGMLGWGGLVGGPSQGIAVGAKLQRGFKIQLYAAVVEGGAEAYERSVEVVRWPWQSGGLEVLPIEEQLAHLLGRRLAARADTEKPPGSPGGGA